MTFYGDLCSVASSFIMMDNITDNATTTTTSNTRIILLPILSVIGLDIIIGNTLLMISIVRFRRLRTKTNIMVGNLALSDLLVGITVIPYEIVMITDKEFGFREYPCLWRQSLFTIILGAAMCSLICISVERYFAIVHPFIHIKRFTVKFLITTAICSWSFAAVIGILPVIGWNKWKAGHVCDNRNVLFIEYNALVYLIYISIITCNFIMFLKILKVVWNHVGNSKSAVDNNTGQKHQNRRQREIIKTKAMVMVLGLFVICWGPFLLYLIIELFFLQISLATNVLKAFFRILGLLNSGINWIVYGAMNRHFRMAFKHIVTFGRMKNKTEELALSSIRVAATGSQRH